ncbi:hypothetical protein MSG28_013195 [Choristoneura fumiferana]|uniref:Uncharacterized protein n=1 Tax=Choristoneura fumiferana TaxID=7141 RepID=A0ACC0KSZ1_CHOFU|nr:hypothetical protein MSG28_013195 [Choristoneura fumiferana]
MSVDLLAQKLQQDILNELITTNQLLQLISHELHQIKQITGPGGEFESNVANNAALVKTLADLQQIDIDKLPPMTRMQIEINHQPNHNNSLEEHDSIRNNSTMDSQ